jgi:hypothetical protein
MSAWSQPRPFSEVCHRAGGRRRYNTLRRHLKLFRRRDVMELVLKYGHQRGVQARIATVLGVSEATISRDIRATLYAPHVCQHCGSYKPRHFSFMKAEDLSGGSVNDPTS